MKYKRTLKRTQRKERHYLHPTGLKDCTGKTIEDGSVIEDLVSGECFYVLWDEDYLKFSFRETKNGDLIGDLDCPLAAEDWEVIGNIYEI